MPGRMKIITLLLFCASLYGHDVEDDFIKWKRYSRIGAITENNEFGVGTYFRINRRTKYTFKDLRLFAHQISTGDTYLKFRFLLLKILGIKTYRRVSEHDRLLLEHYLYY